MSSIEGDMLRCLKEAWLSIHRSSSRLSESGAEEGQLPERQRL